MRKLFEVKNNKKEIPAWHGDWISGKPEELSDMQPAKPIHRDDHWGWHLLCDMSGCNKRMDDPKAVGHFIKELIKELKMQPIGDPMIVKVDAEDGRGLSAVQLITTSTITMHTDDEQRCVYLDVFACKDFDPKIILNSIIKFLEPEHLGYKWIYRDAGEFSER